MSTAGRVAVVTGAGRGLGRAIAEAYARTGMKVMMMSLNTGELASAEREIVSITGGEVISCEGDVSNRADVVRTMQRTLDRFGRIDVLVHNAGIIGPPRFLEDTDQESWEKTIGINLGGIYLGTREALPHMLKNGQGKIIIIVSGLGQMPYPRFLAYAVSKAGAIQFTRSLASEFRDRNIQVNAIDPGVMDTSMQERLREMGPEVLGEEVHLNFVEYRQRGQLKDPAIVADLAVFLASSDSDHLTGEIGTLAQYRRLGWKPSTTL
ncbi:MAG: SDR family NAD(P)-dependent oxidoreductase [Desulfomonilia bacterium]|jgi:NAD(P)-dependent dehydrogenase (short-subunit alcohol dehydrogenase family)